MPAGFPGGGFAAPHCHPGQAARRPGGVWQLLATQDDKVSGPSAVHWGPSAHTHIPLSTCASKQPVRHNSLIKSHFIVVVFRALNRHACPHCPGQSDSSEHEWRGAPRATLRDRRQAANKVPSIGRFQTSRRSLTHEHAHLSPMACTRRCLPARATAVSASNEPAGAWRR